MLTSTNCTEALMRSEWCQDWCIRLGHNPTQFHRKVFEHCYIAQALEERQMLLPNKKGLVFGAGIEALPSYFAAQGCKVHVTDLERELAKSLGWVNTGQHAEDLSELNQFQLCDPKVFADNVTNEVVDMNFIPEHLRNYDWCYSSCSLDHLGTLKKGLDFIKNSLKCLVPGGYALHTTELNLSSTGRTIESGGVVLYRPSDLHTLVQELESQGHFVEPLQIVYGTDPMDLDVDQYPYRHHNHITVNLFGFTCTSVGLIIRKGNHE